MKDPKKSYIQIPIDRWDAEILGIVLDQDGQGIPLKELSQLIETASGIKIDEILRKVSRLSSMDLLRSMYRDGDVGYIMNTTFFLLMVQDQVRKELKELKEPKELRETLSNPIGHEIELKPVIRNRAVDRWKQAIKLMPKVIMGVAGQLYLTPTPESNYGEKDWFYAYSPGCAAGLKIYLYLEKAVAVNLNVNTDNPMSIVEYGIDSKLIASLWAQAYSKLPNDN